MRKRIVFLCMMAGPWLAAAEVAAVEPAPQFVQKWGTLGSGDGQFNEPYGVTVDGTNVYVSDTINYRIQQFTTSGAFVRKWGSLCRLGSGFGCVDPDGGGPLELGDGQFWDGVGLDVDANGDVYMAEFSNHRVQKFSGTGTFILKWGTFGSGNGQFNTADDVAFDTAGNAYVVDKNNDRIQKFSNTGTFLAAWGTAGTGDGQFQKPVGIAIDADDNVYVAEQVGHRIQKFDTNGGFILKWGTFGAGDGQFNEPIHINVDINGNVYVPDSKNHRIQKFDGNGTFLTKWGTFGTGDGQFNEPEAVDVDASGNIYVCDTQNDRIQKFAPAPPAVNYRSIGTDASILASGTASIAQSDTTATLSASLTANVGVGDRVVIGGETFYIKVKVSPTQITTNDPAVSTHTNAAYTVTRAFNTLQAWEDARDGDLVGEYRREVGVCYNDGPFTSGIVINDSTTDANRYMMLTVAEGHRHNGLAGTGARLDAGGGLSTRPIVLQDQYTRLEWIELFNWLDNTAGIYVDVNPADESADNSILTNLLLHDFTAGSLQAAITVLGSNTTVQNTIVYDGDGKGIAIYGAGAIIENCTVYGITGDGVKLVSGNSGSFRNTVSVGNTTADFNLAGTIDYFGYNMFSTTTGFDPNSFQGNNQAPPADLNDLFFSIAPGSENLHLEDGGHNAVDTGLDLSGSFTSDIDGEIRSAPWDMGADEIAAAPLQIISASDQVFTVGDPATVIASITVTDAGDTPRITAANDMRIMIPAAFNMDWDIFDTAAAISGPAAGKVAGSVSYEDGGKTLVMDVLTDFAVQDSVTISGLSFTDFSATSTADYLVLDVDDDANADATDGQTIRIDAPPPSSRFRLLSWAEDEPSAAANPTPISISLDNVTTDVSSSDRANASFSHTVGSCPCCGDPFLVVITMSRGDQGANGVSYGGQALNQAISEKASSSSGAEWVQIWYLTNPPSGSNTVDVTFGINDSPNGVAAISYFGVDSADPIGAVAGNSDTDSSTTVSVTISTTAADSVIVGGLGHHGGDTDPHDHGGDVTTEHFDEASGGATSSDSGYAGGEIMTTATGFYTFQWTGNTSDDYAIACIELKRAP